MTTKQKFLTAAASAFDAARGVRDEEERDSRIDALAGLLAELAGGDDRVVRDRLRQRLGEDGAKRVMDALRRMSRDAESEREPGERATPTSAASYSLEDMRRGEDRRRASDRAVAMDAIAREERFTGAAEADFAKHFPDAGRVRVHPWNSR